MPDFFSLSPAAQQVRSKAPARQEPLPLTPEQLRSAPSGELFGMAQDAGMGWKAAGTNAEQVLLLSTIGGIRKPDGSPLALGYHTGHWELSLLVEEAATRLAEAGCMPFAAHCSDPCDGRSQGTDAMMDSLPYRNSAAETMARLIRSLPRSRSVIGVATCDKGLPAMMMALAECSDHFGLILPGGSSLPPDRGEDAGAVQSIGARFSHGELTLKEAAQLGCAACASPGGGCQFLGTAASSQVIAEALGLALPHSALAPSGEQVWLDLATQSATALLNLKSKGITIADILTDKAVHNAMVVHCAFGGSTNILLHLPAIAFAAGRRRPTAAEWEAVNLKVPRLVDALPNGPANHVTVQVFLAGGVPEVMLHLRDLGLLHLDVLTATGETLGANLEKWENCARRKLLRQRLVELDGVDPDKVIVAPEKGFARTVIFPRGNLCPEGSLVKSTAINPALFKDGVYRHRGPARVFCSEEEAIRAVKGQDKPLLPGEVIVLLCRGPLGAGMPETAQITIALKYTKALKDNVLLTDGRFSGFSSGPCIGHIGPEALAGGPVGRLRDGDLLDIVLDQTLCQGGINLIGPDGEVASGTALLASRTPHPGLRPDPRLPASVKLWAALQQASGGTWAGCVADPEAICGKLGRGL
ncbi:MAG: hypothetical protein RL095_582 [Verrucomicrobiota bacterium]